MEGDRIEQILLEVVEGREPKRRDTEAEARLREKLTGEVAEIAEVRGVVEIPPEITGLR